MSSLPENDDDVQYGLAQIDPRGFMQLRDYKRTLFERSIDSNLIVTLPTGKTLIAIYFIKNKLHQTNGPFSEVARRTIFLAPTRALVDQQFHVIKNLIPTHKVAKLHGDDKVVLSKAEKWSHFSSENQVTPLPSTD